VPDLPAHPALGLFADVTPLGDAELARVLDTVRELRGWMPDEDTLRHAALKLAEVDESRLLVNEQQKLDAKRDVMDREIAAWWTPARRELYRERLLDTAYLLRLVGEREEDARTLRRAAEALGPDAPAAPNPFVRRLFERVLRLDAPPAPPVEAGAGPEPHPGPGGLIVSPYEPAR
jgi:hypothetical protein